MLVSTKRPSGASRTRAASSLTSLLPLDVLARILKQVEGCQALGRALIAFGRTAITLAPMLATEIEAFLLVGLTRPLTDAQKKVVVSDGLSDYVSSDGVQSLLEARRHVR